MRPELPRIRELPELERPAVAAPARDETLADRYYRVRDRVLSNPRFQRWAAGFFLTRFIARRRATALFDLCAGFVYSQVLQAAVRVRLFDALEPGPLELPELARRIGLPLEAAQRLVDAAASLKLVERRPRDRWGLGVHGISLVGNPAVTLMVEHHALLYRDLQDPLRLLRAPGQGTELGTFWSYAGRGGSAPADGPDRGLEQVARYSALMAGSLALLAEDILDAYPMGEHRQLLDVGGGEGAFLEAAATRFPALSLTLFDLPPVAERARGRLARAGLGARATVVGGDVFRDPLPGGADLASLVRIVHDHDDGPALEILKAVRRSLAPGGVLLIAEPMSGTVGAEPMGDAYFGFYLLAMGQGRPRTAEALAELCRAAGFVDARTRPTRRPMLTRLVVARAP